MRDIGTPHPRLPLPKDGQGEDLAAFQTWLGEAIPLVPQLGLSRMEWQDDVLRWHINLQPNLNDKGTGFGGALSAQTTLIGWCWVTLWLRRQGLQQDVVVAEASQRFSAPVTEDYRLDCQPQDIHAAHSLSERLNQQGKGRITLIQKLYCREKVCLEACGDYVVLPARKPD
ncbi:YiiD C-terminal domain-containing protein [Litchfieldella xinjiangensis]|uniref:YiiD C-terminal domain-containing protein n=1 Tax=Litchfieldella xinjiangensis TaxID=1166948 RepID=UPI0005BAC32E|nr:YiiD C-terminal domain-containing protein [Halomonas xinjiangensis]